MIEFQYFDGCPNARATLKNLTDLVAEGIFEGEGVRITLVPSMDQAAQLNFQGSPTILVDGVDIYTGTKPSGYSYNCRVYVLDGRRTGVLSKDYIKARVDALRRGT